jgi:hypothetical protein
VHRRKQARPGPALELPGASLKWYEIAPLEAPVPAEISVLARQWLRREVERGAMNVKGEQGFVLLHRCGEDFYFLLPCTWRNGNELWETVYAKESNASPDFKLFPLDGPHRPTFCVWELGVIWREQQAWDHFLFSNGDDASRADYMRSVYEGPV